MNHRIVGESENQREAYKHVDWFYSKNALARMSPESFDQYVYTPGRQFARGEVQVIGRNKYCAENWFNDDPNQPPNIHPGWQLFRDNKEAYLWVGKEYILLGWLRYWKDDNPERDGVYRYKTNGGDNNTPPPNSWEWEKVEV